MGLKYYRGNLLELISEILSMKHLDIEKLEEYSQLVEDSQQQQ